MSSSRPLLSYRRAGGMAGLSQRLAVHEDGGVELDDRRARTRARIEATPAELERVRAALEAVPASRWSGRVALAARSLLPRPRDAMRIELRRGGRGISVLPGHADADIAPLLAELDALLGRAVREARGEG